MTDTPPVHVLQTKRLYSSCERALAERYVVHPLHLVSDPDTLLGDVAPRVRGVVGGPVPGTLIDRLPKLEIISSFGVGYESVDVHAARSRGIRVTNTPNVLNDAVAELAIGLMIALARQLPQADSFVRSGKWTAASYPLTSELTGRTVGIVGLGRIGKEIAARAHAMRMRVVYHGRKRQADEPYAFYPVLLEMARDVDWLVLAAPGGPGTERLVTRDVLEALGPTGRMVNVGRGSLVDQDALEDLLLTGKLGGAALDVFNDEPNVSPGLLRLKNVVLSPHQGSATVRTREKMSALVVANLDAHFSGEPLISAVA
jgi:lactate dehydrogenase-like 2-hydroxyacid dehydrogenase